MKKLQLILTFLFIAILGYGCTDLNKNAYSGHNSLFEKTSRNVDTISQMASEIKRLDKIQNGVCDTCVTAYRSVIVENRLVAKELSDQTAELREQIELVAMLNNKARDLIENNKTQLSKLQEVTEKNKQEIKRQNHVFYTYSQGDN